MPELPRLTKKESVELIVYQIGEVKNMVGNLITDFKSYKESTDRRLSDLEKLQAAQDIINKSEPKFDIQKIVLAAFALISSVVLAALGINQSNLLK